MKIREFLEKYKKQNLTQSVKNMLVVKSYLPYTEKQELVEKILRKCKVTNYGYIQIDEIKKYLVFTIEIIEAYTDLEFDEDFNVAVTEYDALCEVDALNSVIETFDGEYNAVLSMMAMRQDYILQENSIECQVAKFLNGLSDRLDDVMEAMSEHYKDINITSEDIDKLTQFIGTLGK